MGFLIGTDEAGYGPNLGPLVISATVWEAPDGVAGQDLYGLLAEYIVPDLAGGKTGRRSKRAKTGTTNKVVGTRRAPTARDNGTNRTGPDPDPLPKGEGTRGIPPPIAIADSKLLYSPDRGLQHLERGLWAMLGLFDLHPQTWRDVWRVIAPDALDEMRLVPWYGEYDGPVPRDCDGEDLTLPVEPLRAGLAAAGVRLVAMRSRVIFAHQFNAIVEQRGTKGAALSHETLGLAAEMIERLGPGPISVICDKHGGRDRYADLLAEHFPEAFIEIHGEGGPRSTYRLGPGDRRVEFCFRVRAEACLPVALASMASKYLRELAMRAFNEFWLGHIPNLQPTAGYPVDANRFRADIAEKQRQLNIADRVLWRQR